MQLLIQLAWDYGNLYLLTNLILALLTVDNIKKHYKLDKKLNILQAYYIPMIQPNKENN